MLDLLNRITQKNKLQTSKFYTPSFVESFFISFSMFIGGVAIALFFTWFLISLNIPYENYKVSKYFPTKYGQHLRIEYPALLLADKKPGTLTITLRGGNNTVKTIDVNLPTEIRLSSDFDAASKRKLPYTFDVETNKDIPQTKKLEIKNGGTVQGLGWYAYREITFVSSDLLAEPVTVKIKMETVFGASLRDFINNSVDEKSPLILLVAGFISGAGGVLKNWWDHRKAVEDEKVRLQQEEYEKKEQAKKNKDELWKGLQSESIPTIQKLADQISKAKKEGTPKNLLIEEYEEDFNVLRVNSWKVILAEKIFNSWQGREYDSAFQFIETIKVFENIFLDFLPENTNLLSPLHILISGIKSTLTYDDTQNILNSYKHWGYSIKPILQIVVAEYFENPGNLPMIASTFTKEKQLGYSLLRTTRINSLIDHYRTFPQMSKEITEALRIIENFLNSGVNWRELWQSGNKHASYKISAWLKYHNYDGKQIPFGSEFAELDADLDLYKVKHAVFDQVGAAEGTIVFGDGGGGKTATAFILVNNCRKAILGGGRPETGAFPIYAKFESTNDVRAWFIESVSRTLIDFISDNPDRFLVADASRRMAMGKLMLMQAGNVKQLRIAFQSTNNGLNGDHEEIINQVREIEILRSKKKMGNSEVVNLLWMAMPDGFDRTYFLLDISDDISLDETSMMVGVLAGLSLQLAKLNFFLKIFAPAALKPKLSNVLMLKKLDLTWDDDLLHEILNRRFDKFSGFCNQEVVVKKPHDLLVKAAQKSPRKLIHYGNSLIRYAENNLEESQKLPLDAFIEIRAVTAKNKKP